MQPSRVETFTFFSQLSFFFLGLFVFFFNKFRRYEHHVEDLNKVLSSSQLKALKSSHFYTLFPPLLFSFSNAFGEKGKTLSNVF